MRNRARGQGADWPLAPDIDIALAVNVTNLLDKEYRTTSYYGNDYYGEGRTVRATVKYRW